MPGVLGWVPGQGVCKRPLIDVFLLHVSLPLFLPPLPLSKNKHINIVLKFRIKKFGSNFSKNFIVGRKEENVY